MITQLKINYYTKYRVIKYYRSLRIEEISLFFFFLFQFNKRALSHTVCQ